MGRSKSITPKNPAPKNLATSKTKDNSSTNSLKESGIPKKGMAKRSPARPTTLTTGQKPLCKGIAAWPCLVEPRRFFSTDNGYYAVLDFPILTLVVVHL